MCGYESCVWSMLCPHRFCPSTWEGYSSHPKWLRDSWTFSCMDSQHLKVSGLVFTGHTVKHYYTLWNNEMGWWCHTLFSNLWWQENLLLQYNSTYVHTHLCYVLYRMWLVYKKCYVPSKVVPEVAVPLSASTECTVFQIFLKMSDHPWKETSSVRASLRCVWEHWLDAHQPVSTLALPHSSCVCLCGWLDVCLRHQCF